MCCDTKHKAKPDKTKTKYEKQHSQQQALVLTYCGISDECLSVGHHGIHGHLLVILARDDGDTGLLGSINSTQEKIFQQNDGDEIFSIY